MNTKRRSRVNSADRRREEPASERELSQRQAVESAREARATHRSNIPGVADDSEVIQGWAAALAAPIEGAADALREPERARVQSSSAGTDVDSMTVPRPTDASNVTDSGQRRDNPPGRPEDAEWDPLKATAEHRSKKRSA